MDIGDNVGAKLQAEQAEADKFVAQAKAEMRRAAAVASEQEIKAACRKAREGRRGRGPGAARHGRGVPQRHTSGCLDYLKMKNIQSDTQMRESIAGTDKPMPGQ